MEKEKLLNLIQNCMNIHEIMNETSLKAIKDRLREFYKVVKPICEHWSEGQPHLDTLIVLLQNMQFSGEECEGYSHEKAVKELLKLQLLIDSISEYYNSHLEIWIANEVNLIINSESFCE